MALTAKQMESGVYGIIVEWKTEGPLIFEGKPMTEEQAYDRLKFFESDSKVIRAAIFTLTYASGNETLISK